MIHSAAKDTLILLPIDRQDVENGDISSVLMRLWMLSADRSSAMSAEGAVSLSFSGYDDDTRPLHAIPEVRAWFQKLHAAWPYWSFFASRTDETIGIVMTLLLPGRSVPGVFAGQHGWEFDIQGLKPLLLELFAAQNKLIERMDIPESVNERVSNDFLQAVMASVDEI